MNYGKGGSGGSVTRGACHLPIVLASKAGVHVVVSITRQARFGIDYGPEVRLEQVEVGQSIMAVAELCFGGGEGVEMWFCTG